MPFEETSRDVALHVVRARSIVAHAARTRLTYVKVQLPLTLEFFLDHLDLCTRAPAKILEQSRGHDRKLPKHNVLLSREQGIKLHGLKHSFPTHPASCLRRCLSLVGCTSSQ